MRTLLALALLAAAGFATERVSFKLPTLGGPSYGVQDFNARYVLLVYQGIP